MVCLPLSPCEVKRHKESDTQIRLRLPFIYWVYLFAFSLSTIVMTLSNVVHKIELRVNESLNTN